MASPVDAQLLLCDAAVADASGKLHMLGAGWSVTSSPTAPHAVAILLKVPWDRANQKIRATLNLLDSDGRPVLVTSGSDQVPIKNEADLEVGRPPGLAPGTPLDVSLAMSIPSLPLAPGRYEWRFDVVGSTFAAGFQVR